MHVFFINTENSRYDSVGFFPANDYPILVEFGGSLTNTLPLPTSM
jgi:hypothetical protein